MLLNIVNKRNEIINRQIISSAMVNNDSNIFINLNKFPGHGSNDATGYYEKINEFNNSCSVLMFSSEINNEEDGDMNINQELPLPNTGKYKSIFYNS